MMALNNNYLTENNQGCCHGQKTSFWIVSVWSRKFCRNVSSRDEYKVKCLHLREDGLFTVNFMLNNLVQEICQIPQLNLYI